MLPRNTARASSADTDSINGIQKSKRPPNTAFRQQRLKAWQPILSPQSILPLLVVLSAVFAPIGIGLILSSNNVQDIVVNYSECDRIASDEFSAIPSKWLSYHFKGRTEDTPKWRHTTDDLGNSICQISFTVPETISGPVYVYYKLTNFYQNHRKYVQSYDLRQLTGEAVRREDLSASCKPLSERDDKVIYPCGLIANSMFNDTFSQRLQGQGETPDYELSNKEISWKRDRGRYKKTTYNVSDIVPPPSWTSRYPDGYTDSNLPDLSTWEEFQVWMRTAGLPTFYKLALKNDQDHLQSGTYNFDIGMNYPVNIFGGTKSLVITTNNIVGTRNLSLGIAYLLVAGISLFFGFIFLAKLIIQPRKLGDHAYLNFDKHQEPSTEPPINNQLREML
ncbi:HDL158Wp [Eremothecium sinecaudum]|uniref:HDL158Wp n=1 Tax=Eremothecium sinecaudum TaxID=45286 RepID=A0A0X8HSD8_9SACH|nr:HDL158Wp [Eremothecium sinecaudum]AMD20586.1 HDL158Wp [Eremothecium sinecaudum]